MNRDKKIEKINAYRKLLDSTLKKVSADEEIQTEVQGEFQTWVSAQVDALMGNQSITTDAFNEQEILILKSLAAKTLSKINEASTPGPSISMAKPKPSQPPAPQPRTGENEGRKQMLRSQPAPRRRSGESDNDFVTRLAEWEDAQES